MKMALLGSGIWRLIHLFYLSVKKAKDIRIRFHAYMDVSGKM
jgi:hypothetical protein